MSNKQKKVIKITKEQIKEMKEKLLDCFNHMKGHFLLILLSEFEGALKGNSKLMDRLRLLIVDLENEGRIRLNLVI